MLSPAARAVLAELNDIVAPDGAALRVRSASASTLVVDLDLRASSCPECVVPKDLLLDILTSRLRDRDPDLTSVELHDPRVDVDAPPPTH